MNTTARQRKEMRVAMQLAPLQEDALIGLMFDMFVRNNFKHLDYNKVRRYAFDIQTDPVICASMDAEPCGEGEVWSPSDEFITDMCLAFLAHKKAEAQKASRTAFGGGRDVEYDPKNPHARPGAASRAANRRQQRAAARSARLSAASSRRPSTSSSSSSSSGPFDMQTLGAALAEPVAAS